MEERKEWRSVKESEEDGGEEKKELDEFGGGSSSVPEGLFCQLKRDGEKQWGTEGSVKVSLYEIPLLFFLPLFTSKLSLAIEFKEAICISMGSS